jgi:hypothetical protein
MFVVHGLVDGKMNGRAACCFRWGNKCDGVGTNVNFCAPGDAILCSLYVIQGLVVGA